MARVRLLPLELLGIDVQGQEDDDNYCDEAAQEARYAQLAIVCRRCHPCLERIQAALNSLAED